MCSSHGFTNLSVFRSKAQIETLIWQSRFTHINWIWSCKLSNAKQNLKNNAIVRNEFATNANQDNRFDQVSALQQKRPAASLKKKIQLDNVMSDNAMISIYPLGSKYYCFYESPFIRCIDPISLSTLDLVDLNKKMGLFQCSSHPQVCIAFGYFYSLSGQIK